MYDNELRAASFEIFQFLINTLFGSKTYPCTNVSVIEFYICCRSKSSSKDLDRRSRDADRDKRSKSSRDRSHHRIER